MRATMKTFVITLVAAMALLAVACSGGSDGGNQTANPPVNDGGEDSSNLFVSNPVAALGASADRFEQEVQSLQATFSFEMSMAEFEMGAEGDFAYSAPDQLHMNMKLSGTAEGMDLSEFGAFEILALGDKIYMKM